MKTFSKGSFSRFLPKNGPRGGAFYQISPDVTLTTCVQLYSKDTPKAIFWTAKACFFGFSAPKLGGVRMKTFSKGSFARFSQKMAPGGGGVYQSSPDVALTTCIQLYSKRTEKAIFWTANFFFSLQRPQNRRRPHENIFKRLIYPFFFGKMASGGGGFLPDFTRRGTNYLHATFT